MRWTPIACFCLLLALPAHVAHAQSPGACQPWTQVNDRFFVARCARSSE